MLLLDPIATSILACRKSARLMVRQRMERSTVDRPTAETFGLLATALGYQLRLVYDTTDHVWVEVYHPAECRWLHVDPCEGASAIDTPLLYEYGWGKQLVLIVGFGRDHVVDLTPYYTRQLESLTMVQRRRALIQTETWLQSLLHSLSTSAFQRCYQEASLATQTLARQQLTRDSLTAVATLCQHTSEKARTSPFSYRGRQSGSQAWRSSRDELGGSTHNHHPNQKSTRLATCHASVMTRISETSDVANFQKDTQQQQKQLFRQWTQGCCDEQHKKAMHHVGSCAHHPRNGTTTLSERVIIAIGLLTSWTTSLSFTSSSLEIQRLSRQCQPLTHLEHYITSFLSPVLYWPLQDTIRRENDERNDKERKN